GTPNPAPSLPGLLVGLRVLLHAQLIGRIQGTSQHVFGHGSETNMGSAVPSPSTGNGDEYIGHLRDKVSLLLGREHQIALPQMLRSKRGENSATDSKIRLSHVRTLFRRRQAERNPTKIVSIHEPQPPFPRVSGQEDLVHFWRPRACTRRYNKGRIAR